MEAAIWLDKWLWLRWSKLQRAKRAQSTEKLLQPSPATGVVLGRNEHVRPERKQVTAARARQVLVDQSLDLLLDTLPVPRP